MSMGVPNSAAEGKPAFEETIRRLLADLEAQLRRAVPSRQTRQIRGFRPTGHARAKTPCFEAIIKETIQVIESGPDSTSKEVFFEQCRRLAVIMQLSGNVGRKDRHLNDDVVHALRISMESVSGRLLRNNIFQICANLQRAENFEEHFIGPLRNGDAWLPRQIRLRVFEWHKTCRSAPPAPALLSGIPVIEIRDLLPEKHETTGIRHRTSKTTDVAAPAAIPKSAESPLELIIERLYADGYSAHHMTIYTPAKNETGDKNLYNILDVNNGERHIQIAVPRDWGHYSYVIRSPFSVEDLTAEEGLRIDTARLNQAPLVYRFRCLNVGQWLKDMARYAYPAEDPPPQIKTLNDWHDKMMDVLNSLFVYRMDQGRMPRIRDKSPIKHGPLKGEERSWYRLYHALHGGSVDGLCAGTTFTMLEKAIFGPNPNAAVEKIKQTGDISAQSPFNDAAQAQEIIEKGTPLIQCVPAFQCAAWDTGHNEATYAPAFSAPGTDFRHAPL